MEARCERIVYKPGEFQLTQGIKEHSRGRYEDGKFFRNRGYGWGEHARGSKLILYVMVSGESFTREIWIDRFFKDYLGRLTEKRRILIKRTMPETINVEKSVNKRGTKYYQVSEMDLNAWLARCNDATNQA